MKKVLFGLLMAGVIVFGASAAEKVRWPVWFAFNGVEDIDVVGLRLNLPSGECEQVRHRPRFYWPFPVLQWHPNQPVPQ